VPRALVLLRHGRTSWNLAGRAQGHADIELDDVGRAQAVAAAEALATLRPARLWSSDLVRASETAAILGARAGLDVELDKRLREYDVGGRQGLTVPEFAEQFPDEYAAWATRDDHSLVEGAESTADVLDRIVPALTECLAVLDADDVGVVVGHGASLRTGLVGLLGWSPDAGRSLRGFDNCAWAVVEQPEDSPALRLAAYNVTAQGPPDFASGPRPR
jgi:probable phosphoglycerate mutase